MLRFMASGAGLTLLAGCSPASPPAASSTVPPAAPAASGSTSTSAKPATQPKTGGTLRLGIVGDLATLDPNFPTPVAYSSLWQAFDRLIQNDINTTRNRLQRDLIAKVVDQMNGKATAAAAFGTTRKPPLRRPADDDPEALPSLTRPRQ